jgi:hypothetical protein
LTLWSEHWRAAEDRLQAIEAALREDRAAALRGGDFDRWDLEVRGGVLGAARTCMVIEEHGAGRQLIRFRSWPRCLLPARVLIPLFTALSIGAALDHEPIVASVVGATALLLALRTYKECATAISAVRHAIGRAGDDRDLTAEAKPVPAARTAGRSRKMTSVRVSRPRLRSELQ